VSADNSSAVAKPVSHMVWSSTRLGGERRFCSTWSALGNPVFRKLWIAAVISGTCVAAHDTAAMWMMNMLTPSPFLISLLSTVASLPFFLFTLPAGALADMVDRKKLLCAVNLWLAAAAGRPGDSWLATFSQSKGDPGFRISHRSRFRSECTSLDVERV
jgi:hypothetical protein